MNKPIREDVKNVQFRVQHRVLSHNLGYGISALANRLEPIRRIVLRHIVIQIFRKSQDD